MPKVFLFKVRLNAGGYDSDGHYFGTGEQLWEYDDGDDVHGHLRAPDRAAAREAVLKIAPGAEVRR